MRKKLEALIEELRWLLVALIPKPIAEWLWCSEKIPLGSWAPYILGQSIGCRGQRVQKKEE